jgi:hypothetical protein
MSLAIFWGTAQSNPHVNRRFGQLSRARNKRAPGDTTRRYISEDGNIHSYHSENVKS